VRPAAPAVGGYENGPVPLPAPGGSDPAQRFADGAAVAQQWWEAFQSPALAETLTLALAGSPTLASAQATLAQAEELVVAARAGYLPQIDASLAGSREHEVSLTGGSSTSARRGTSVGSSLVTNMFSVGALMSYTPDLFGRNRRTVEQQAALAETQRYQLGAAYLTLTAEAVSQALTIATTLAEIKATQDIIAADEHNLELVRISFEAGLVARTDVLSAESQLAGDRTLLPPLQQQLSVARHALSVIAGKTPAEWTPPDFELDALALPRHSRRRGPAARRQRRDRRRHGPALSQPDDLPRVGAPGGRHRRTGGGAEHSRRHCRQSHPAAVPRRGACSPAPGSR